MKKLLALMFLTVALLAIGAGHNHTRKTQSAAPTFSNEVVRIFQRNCQVCHHPGDIAPFSLMSYREARPWARSIQERVVMRSMPPWKATAGCGEFQDARVLTDEEISTISQWVENGSPEGDTAMLPAPLDFSSNWALGEPDMILTPDEDYTVEPGRDIYRCFTMPTNLKGDRFVQAVDIKPGNRNVVHHVILYIDETGASVDLDAKDPGPGYTSFGGPGFDLFGTLGGWAPGERARLVPDGVAYKVKAGSRIVAQVHYHPRGLTEKDRTQIGIYFSRKPVTKGLNWAPILNTNFTIPADNANYPVNAALPIPLGFDAHAIGIFPHMHLLGKKMKVEARSIGGTECLINIDDWNFNWQGAYYYKEPVALKGGTLLTLNAIFDNSANNPFNPNSPPKAVRWGEQTTDEMAIAFVLFTFDSDNLALSSPHINGVEFDASSNRLIVTGSGFLIGADIEINGVRVKDTRNHKKAKKASKHLYSSDDWQRLLPRGTTAKITVLNTDGVRSAEYGFTLH
ncbi:MAG: ascorbate-dependent monooxygenase [Acidobacteriota bacterium]